MTYRKKIEELKYAINDESFIYIGEILDEIESDVNEAIYQIKACHRLAGLGTLEELSEELF